MFEVEQLDILNLIQSPINVDFNKGFLVLVWSSQKWSVLSAPIPMRWPLLVLIQHPLVQQSECRILQSHCFWRGKCLIHFTSLHFTSLRFTSLHFTSLHFTSLHFTSLRFTSLHFTKKVGLSRSKISSPF